MGSGVAAHLVLWSLRGHRADTQPTPASNPYQDATIRRDIADSVSAIEGVLGRPIGRYHTPYAADTDGRVRNIVAEMGFLPVGWEVAAADYADWTTETDVSNRVMNNVYPGAVIEFHLDGPATETSTARALPRIIDGLRARGYDLVTVPDLVEPCLGSSSEQTGAAATVVNTGGAGLNCRVAPTTAASRISTLAAGAAATVRGATECGWVPVICGGSDDWVSATYLTISTGAPGADTGTVTTGGLRANCRAAPSLSGAIITSLANGTEVAVRGSASYGWVPIRCANRDGRIFGELIDVD